MKTALILSGGGSRGAYEIGVCKALKELKIDVDMVFGTSVGAITGALVAQDSIEEAERLWLELTADKVFDIEGELFSRGSGDNRFQDALDDIQDRITRSIKKKSIAGMPAEDAIGYLREMLSEGGAGTTGLRELLEEYIDEDRIRNSPIEFGLVTTEYPTMKGAYMSEDDIPEGQLRDYILASASCFPAAKVCEIGDRKYIDGGYTDNMPLIMALNRDAGNIIAVNLDAVGTIHKEHLRKAEKHAMEKGGYFRYIKSYADLGNFLSFGRERAARLIEQGRIDCLKAFRVYDGNRYAFEKGAFTAEEIKSADRLAGTLEIDTCRVYDRETYLQEILRAYSQRRSLARLI
ncbi:MAG: patatin-like phospholipase family protein [Clostridiales bacterium]|nr:patatin-like phospholipase family protein [Clostridiales bacterium]MDD7035048.1 patatin-like phospholipase family protein [Bacillota bacterium]MDY2920373.1 patatin-like phospholipase family protein [Lentihominibacter sp.]